MFTNLMLYKAETEGVWYENLRQMDWQVPGDIILCNHATVFRLCTFLRCCKSRDIVTVTRRKRKKKCYRKAYFYDTFILIALIFWFTLCFLGLLPWPWH